MAETPVLQATSRSTAVPLSQQPAQDTAQVSAAAAKAINTAAEAAEPLSSTVGRSLQTAKQAEVSAAAGSTIAVRPIITTLSRATTYCIQLKTEVRFIIIIQDPR